MTKCYVVQENNAADYGDAERFGEVVFATVDEFRPIKGSLMNNAIIGQLKKTLANFGPDDFLILTGNPTMIGFAFTIAMSRLGPTEGLNVLRWDRMHSQYRPFTFNYKP